LIQKASKESIPPPHQQDAGGARNEVGDEDDLFSDTHQAPESESDGESDPFSDAHALMEEFDEPSSGGENDVPSANAHVWNLAAGNQTMRNRDRGNENDGVHPSSANEIITSDPHVSIGTRPIKPAGNFAAKHSRSKSFKENILNRFRSGSKEKKEMTKNVPFVPRNKAEAVFGEKLSGYTPLERRFAGSKSTSI
jgi:hypothetical protein